ncbi:hypothetical protein EXIGLDRAFT_766444 [Exidia glandulosa HHB12029]|uniref:GLTSCR protein conserved domain-containing protein n=1 Tax=Exidia glandulosa HHB12029 TaxID=1314781 RepID=A0A165JQ79_EXIGL|nr:hypothetical protein EXIGLDRAFT_766444 [Exidia glandulosa HHB12029]
MLSSHNNTSKRVLAAISSDHALALYPDTDTPFLSETDKVHRLLPYHVFQQHKQDIDRITNYSDPHDPEPRDPQLAELQGTFRNPPYALQTRLKACLSETRFAIDCHKRFRALRKRFRDIRTRDAQRQYPGGDAVVLAQAVLESDRSFNNALHAELRAMRHAAQARPAQMAPPPPPPGYVYRPYPSPSPERFATPIPVQLPARLLPVLTGMGIVPVLQANLPPAGEPQPACVQLGTVTNADGTATLSLTINLSLLQPVQMSSLAALLNSLVPRPPAPAPASS